MNHENKIAIPTERIEDVLRQGAVPGFWGTIRIAIRLNQTAALEVDLLAEKISVSDGKSREVSNVIPAMNGRFNKVKLRMAELREVFNLFCPVTQVEAIFQDGELVRFAVTEVKEPADRMRYAPPPAVHGG